MDDNHKIPALLPHKLVKALAEYMDFKPDGTAEFGKDLEVDGKATFSGGNLAIQRITEIEEYPFGLYTIINSQGDAYLILGDTEFKDDGMAVSGFIYSSNDGIYFSEKVNDNYAIFDSDLVFDPNTSMDLNGIARRKYTHTVTITQTSSSKTFSFTASGVGTNLNVDSLQDLETVFGGEKHAGSGTLGSLLDTHATSPADYTVDGVKIGACTITDDVFIPN